MTSRACPTCGNPLLPGELQGAERVMACLCGYVEHTGGQMPARAVVVDTSRPEAKLVGEIEDALKELKYKVTRVGQHIAKHSGTTRGCPDLFIYTPHWYRFTGPMYLALEVKTEDGVLSEDQQTYAEEDGVITVRSVEEAVRAVMNPPPPHYAL